LAERGLSRELGKREQFMSDQPSEASKEIVIVEKSTPWAGLLSLIFGIISVFSFGVLFGTLGFIFGVVALFKGQIVLAIVGIVLSLIGFGSSLFFAVGLPALLGFSALTL
jgi:uncharacterized membrane protein